jgi:hypothetical protein
MPSGDSLEHQDQPSAPQRSPLSRVLQASTVLLTALGFGLVVRFRLAISSFLDESTRGVRSDWLRAALFGALGLLCFLMLQSILLLIRFTSRQGQSQRHPPKTVEQFIEDAGRLHITPRIAREAFQLFASLIPEHTSIDLNDNLRLALKLSDSQISSLVSSLPDLCGRSENPADIASIVSVYDLLHHLECAPSWKPGQLDQRNGPMIPPLAASAASPLAGLQDASPRDSRFRTRAHFSGVKRRASDYSGPYRRSTDRRPEDEYTGPRRRSADRQPGDGQVGNPMELISQASDRRVLDRRQNSQQSDPVRDPKNEARQRKAVDISLLNMGPAGAPASPAHQRSIGTPPEAGVPFNAGLTRR